MPSNTEMKFMQAIADVELRARCLDEDPVMIGKLAFKLLLPREASVADARKAILAFLRRELDVNVIGFAQVEEPPAEYPELVLEAKNWAYEGGGSVGPVAK